MAGPAYLSAVRCTLLPQMLRSIPDEWKGTTFKNHALLGREGFTAKLHSLLQDKVHTGEAVTTQDLVNLGNAEDYLRVATNVSTTLEAVLALERGLTVSQVFSFASVTMPIVAVALVASEPVHLYHGSSPSPLTPEQLRLLSFLGGEVTCHDGAPPPMMLPSFGLVLCLEAAQSKAAGGHVDGMVSDNGLLFINDAARIPPEAILVLRKRMATPATH